MSYSCCIDYVVFDFHIFWDDCHDINSFYVVFDRSDLRVDLSSFNCDVIACTLYDAFVSYDCFFYYLDYWVFEKLSFKVYDALYFNYLPF